MKNFNNLFRTRFKPVFQAMGFESLGPLEYARKMDGFLHKIGIQSSSRRKDVFYVNFGIAFTILPYQRACGPKEAGLALHERLAHNDSKDWPKISKEQLSELVPLFKESMEQQALPWFARFRDWASILEEYARIHDLTQLGVTKAHKCLAVKQYASMLLKSGDKPSATDWFKESLRLYELEPDFDEGDSGALREIIADLT